MGVSLRYCDLCGTKMSAEQLEDPATLKIQNKIFCGECRPKVIAKIQAQKAKAQQQAGGEAPRAAASKAAGKPAPRRGAAPKRAAAATSAAAKRGAAPRAGAAKAKASRPAAGKRAAAGARGGGLKSGRGAAGRKPARGEKPARSRDEALVVGADDDADPRSFHAKKKSNAPVIIIVSMLFIVTIAAVAYVMSQEEEAAPVVVEKVEEPKIDMRLERSKKALADAKKYREENPTKYAYQYQKFSIVEANFKTYDSGREAKKLAGEVQDAWRAAADANLSKILARVQVLIEDLKFDEAHKIAIAPDDAIETYNANFNWDGFTSLKEVREDSKRQVAAYDRLLELTRKAIAYAKKSPPEDDIATAILEEFDSRFEELKVWEIYEKNMAKINKASIEGFGELDREMSALIAKREAERKQKEAAARQKAWDETRGAVTWWPHIGRHNLRNWIAQSGKWELQVRDGKGVMVGTNPGSTSTTIGIFGSHWQDYVVRFDVNIKKGTLQVSPRSVVASRVGLQNTSQLIDLPAADVGSNQWVTIEMEVQGDEVRVFKNRAGASAAPWKTFKGGYDGEFRLLDAGGPAFMLTDDTTVEIRNFETKLVAHNRPGGF